MKTRLIRVMETDKLILVVSLAINVSLLLYFFQPLALVWFLKKQKRGRRTTEVICCYERRPNILRKLLKDFVFSSALFAFGIYLLVHRKIYKKPFEHFVDDQLQAAMAAQIGNWFFRLLHPLVPTQDIKGSFSANCYGIVTVFSLLIILITEESNVFGLLSLLFEGSIMCSDFSRAEKQWNDDACARRTLHVITLLGNLLTTLSLRMICPTILLAYGIQSGNPLQMSYFSLSLFILDVIFYYSLCILELFSIHKSLRTWLAGRRANDAENDMTGPTTTTMNNNMYSSLTAFRSATNNLENAPIVTEQADDTPQAIRASKLLNLARGPFIKNW